jgi:hypothetical protein
MRMVTVLHVKHLATMGDIPEARGESNPQTRNGLREQGPLGGRASGGNTHGI